MSKQIVIYTRYSSEMQREDSCEDQKREVCQGLARLGIDAQEATVIEDKAESGTKTNRAGFERLSAMIDHGEVSILAVDDQSRLSRGDNASSFITDLVYSGGRFVSTGEGIDTNQEGWELRVKIMEVHNGATIRDLGRRVHRGQKGRVLTTAPRATTRSDTSLTTLIQTGRRRHVAVRSPRRDCVFTRSRPAG